jgi:hypothetical protein
VQLSNLLRLVTDVMTESERIMSEFLDYDEEEEDQVSGEAVPAAAAVPEYPGGVAYSRVMEEEEAINEEVQE